MKKIVFLAGLLGVGKSTIERKLAERVGVVAIDVDEIKREIVDHSLVVSTIDLPEIRWKYYEKAVEKAFSLLEKEVSAIIVDEISHLQSLRQRLEILCTKRGLEVLWVEVQCSREEVKRRLRINRNGHILSVEEALKMSLLFEGIFEKFPDDKTNYIVFKNEDDCDVDSIVF